MKYTIALLLFACCLTLAAEHVYPTNPDPAHTAFFGQLGRDSIVVTNPPPSMTADEAADIANHAITTNAATTNLTARLAEKANASDLTYHTSDINNPHQVTASQVGALEANHPQFGPMGGQISWGGNGVLNIGAGSINAPAANALFSAINAPFGVLTSFVLGDSGVLYLGSGKRSSSIYVGDNKIGNDDALHLQNGSNIVFDDHEEDIDQRITRIAREHSGDYWDEELQVWWTGRMSGGKLTYMATTNVNLNAEH